MIPTPCCAGAEHDQQIAPYPRLRRAGRRRVRYDRRDSSGRSSIDDTAFAVSLTHFLAFADAYLLADADTLVDTYTNSDAHRDAFSKPVPHSVTDANRWRQQWQFD
jgi:hypothetical protein